MFGINWRQKVKKIILTSVIAAVLTMGLASCGDRFSELPKLQTEKKAITSPIPTISEVSPPTAIQKLGRYLDRYQPQVTILSPQPEKVLQDNTVNVQLQVKDLPIFKSDLGLGPHLKVILDDRHYKEIYDPDEPLTIKDLEPGTHTLRVFANRPWEESFKNEGAYAQTTFHVFTKTPYNNPNSDRPLLTYNSPKGLYGAQPILLDFYLTNAPLHFVAQEDLEDDIADWRIKVTVNGTSFTSDRWQPIYLKGFKPGKNWLQLEFLDELGNPINNTYNNTARLITYEPNGQDPLSKLVRGELPLTELLAIVDPNYKPEPVEPEEISPIKPTLEEEEVGEPSASGEEKLTPKVIKALETEEQETPPAERSLVSSPIEEVPETPSIEIEEQPTPTTSPSIEEKPAPVVLPSPIEEVPETPSIEIEEQPTPTTSPSAEEKLTPAVQPTTSGETLPPLPTIEEEETSTGELDLETTSVEPTPSVEPLPSVETTAEELNNTETTDGGTLLNNLLRRFKEFRLGTSTPDRAEESENLATEEKFNFGTLLNSLRNRFSGDSETIPPTVEPTLPEIIEEAPVPEPAEELTPQDSSNLVPEKEAITEEIESEKNEELVVPESVISPREERPESNEELAEPETVVSPEENPSEPKEIKVEVTEVTSKSTEEEVSPETTEIIEELSGENEVIFEAIESPEFDNLETTDKTEVIEVIPDRKDENSVYLEKKTTETIVVTEKNDENKKQN